MLVMNALFVVTAVGFGYSGWKVRGWWDRFWEKRRGS